MSDVRIKYVSWRNGRPRFQPGRAMRVEGLKGFNLRHADGRWYSFEEAVEWSIRFAAARPDAPKRAEKHGTARARRAVPMNRKGFVYFLWSGARIKIGFSTRPVARIQSLAAAGPDEVHFMAAIEGTRADEKMLHESLASHRVNGEWFRSSFTVIRAIQRRLNAALEPAGGEIVK